MNRREIEKIRERERVAKGLNNWLRARFEPVENQNGTEKTRRGLLVYNPAAIAYLSKFFNRCYRDFDDIRKGENCCPSKFRDVKRLLDDGEHLALEGVFNETYRTEIRSAIGFHGRFGTSPNGKPNDMWADEVEGRLNRIYSEQQLDEDSLALREQFLAMQDHAT